VRGWHARKLLRWPQEVDCSVDQDTRPVRLFYLDVFQALFLFYSTFDTAVLKSMSLHKMTKWDVFVLLL